jgi:hypothetical protein
MVKRLVTIGCFGAGLAAGVKVTRRLHEDPDAGRWGERLGSTRLRYANIPLGGAVALGVASIAPDIATPAVRALGLGALVGALGYGFVDPLPPAD